MSDSTELYAVRAVGWKKGSYTDRNFEDVASELKIDADGTLHLILKKTFGGYTGGEDDRYIDRILDIKFDSISLDRMKVMLDSVKAEEKTDA